MSLSARVAAKFTANVRQRGAGYYRLKRVHIAQGSASELRARVNGSRTYHVALNFKDGTLSVSCDCPYFTDNAQLCKHLWATIITGDECGYLGAAASAQALFLDTDENNFEYEPGPGDYGTEDEIDRGPNRAARVRSASLAAFKNSPARPSSWQQQLSDFLANRSQIARPVQRWPAKRQVIYIVDASSRPTREGLPLSLYSRDQRADGSWGAPQLLALSRAQIAQMPLAEDREILSALAGAERYMYGYLAHDQLPGSFLLDPPLAGRLVPSLCRTGRCWRHVHGGWDQMTPMTWDEDGAWSFELEIRAGNDRTCALVGSFRRGEQPLEVAAPILVTPGLIFTLDRVAPLTAEGSWDWILALRTKRSITVPQKQRDEFLAALLASPDLPRLVVPEEMAYDEVTLPANPRLEIRKHQDHYKQERLLAELSFAYDGRVISSNDSSPGFFDVTRRQFVRRDPEVEKTAADFLEELGVKLRPRNYSQTQPFREISGSRLPRVVRSLVDAGWHVEAENRLFRRPGSMHLEVSSGVDWFELHGSVQYGDTTAHLPELLDALRRGQRMVQLSDGSYGMLPEEWLRRFGPVSAMGTPENGHVRFERSQATLLDALLATQADARCDDGFAAFRQELQRFAGVEAAEQPAGFVGSLRDYQRDGLGWMHFLRRFSFGGCLADDMGVGKTAQVLALLETRRELRAAGEPVGPSLVVVPKSLVFNWRQEAARFTPRLRVLDHIGVERSRNDFGAYDVIITTYGTLRRDILRLKDIEFDYVVLDEAQAAKNANSQSSKAVRLLKGRHRLALSGTPVENHLGELWSLFEFLNPGMLGAASVFRLGGAALLNPDEQSRLFLGQALRPFILRRTKEQVARELPPKSEQTLYCEMESNERKRYEELRQHYRNSLLKRIETEGLAKSRIQVFEALLRLRQAACHPGLLSAERQGEPSAKLDLLMEQLHEVLDEGHKALVFSQFTTFLKIVRHRLDKSGTSYEYLDGATRDRQARVERFQSDPDCRIFLISLKAGGLGLNLTAAEYIFILDPWWNPAVEAQAMDRAHRIGQTRPVFAYRLITRATVEEKVLDLQRAKRDLAAAIITADNSLIRNLQAEDLAILLS